MTRAEIHRLWVELNTPTMGGAARSPRLWVTVLAIAALSTCAYGLKGGVGLFADDWVQAIQGPVMGVGPLSLERSRPLLYAPFVLQYWLLGTDVPAYHILLLVLQAANAILVAVMLERFQSMRYHRLGLLVALLYLV